MIETDLTRKEIEDKKRREIEKETFLCVSDFSDMLGTDITSGTIFKIKEKKEKNYVISDGVTDAVINSLDLIKRGELNDNCFTILKENDEIASFYNWYDNKIKLCKNKSSFKRLKFLFFGSPFLIPLAKRLDSLFDIDTFEFLLPLLLFMFVLTVCVLFPIYEMGFLLKDIKEINDDKKIFVKNIKEQQGQIDIEKIKQIEMVENSERKPISLLKSYLPKEEMRNY